MDTPLDAVLDEIARAVEKFPTWPTDPHHAINVVQEEVGEVTKEIVQCTYEPSRSAVADVRREAVQLAAMALRFLISIDRYEFTPGPQHEQEPLR